MITQCKMQNAKFKMQTRIVYSSIVNVAATFTDVTHRIVFAFCILHFAF